MKRHLFLLSPLFFLFFLSCDKKSPLCCAIPPRWYIQAQSGDSAWYATPQLSVDSVSSKTWVAMGKNEQVLWFTLKRNNNNQWGLDTAGYYTTLGKDVIVNEYALTSDATNTLTVKNRDAAIFEGTFDITLKRIDTQETNGPSVIRFTQGEFRVPAKKQSP